ncbi:hypothetical protein AWJ14_09400 [Hoeflea olei]|uniref:Uncharacterized protein n=1 Tax=Hoeflea olei TaxID=1480615 RepID=A0A1C1Z0G6_9HYPH|nr:hypothetical protein AWJ14_09400 [Hoeflea olei]
MRNRNIVLIALRCAINIKSTIIVGAIHRRYGNNTVVDQVFGRAFEKATDQNVVGVSPMERVPAADIRELKNNGAKFSPTEPVR